MQNTSDANIRALPIYRLGWSEGHDLGLRQALDAITAERRRLDELASRDHDSHSMTAARIAFAGARLGTVAQAIAAIFRFRSQ
jgi:hypothetical protein